MGVWESGKKQFAGNNRIISLFIAATALSFLIICSLPSSSIDDDAIADRDGESTVQTSQVKLDFIFPSVSDTSQPINYGKNISVQEHDEGGSTSQLENRQVESNPLNVSQSQTESNPLNVSQSQMPSGNSSVVVLQEIEAEAALENKEDILVQRQQQQLGEENISSNSNKGIEEVCDIYSGKWVHDDSYPLYPAGECPYMSADFNCKANGRQDSDYTKWRWQPSHCELPRLNPRDMLERLRGKRVMFIGDSINRNQWESLLCILRTVVPDNRKYFGRSNDGATTFLALDYNCSVEFFWAPFLVEQGSINVGNKSKEILRLDAIHKHGSYWKDVDILVFNTGHWWTHGNKVTSNNFYMENEYLHPELDPLVAFKTGLNTWAKWIDENIDPTKTKVFFRGFSPMHFSSRQWKKERGHKCNFETEPILKEEYITAYPERMKMVEEVVGQMKFPVWLMNITRLSDFRKDAHPSIYTMRNNKQLTPEQRNNPDQYGDCSHWCLPGLPDIWNELLYGSLLMHMTAPSH